MSRQLLVTIWGLPVLTSPAGVELRGDVVVIRADLEGGPRGRLGREELEKGLLAIS